MLIHFHDDEALQKLPRTLSRVVSASTKPSIRAYAPNRPHWKAYGLHPMFAHQNTEEELKILRARCENKEVGLIGEIGLDFRKNMPERSQQERVFLAQLQLAQSYGLPVILHVVKAHEQTLAIIDDFPNLRAVMHGYTRSPELAQRFLQRGIFIGLGPAILSPINHQAECCARFLPLDRILVESDSPSAPPNGDRASPELVEVIAEKIAALRKLNPQEVSAQLERNVDVFFAPKSPHAKP